jgi:hypothetical protein
MPNPQVDAISGDVIGAAKQKSWFHTDVPFENSFKFWFALMWQNKYIQLFTIGLIITIIELINFNKCINSVPGNWSEDGALGGLMTAMAWLIGPSIVFIISYKGFYQYWNNIKKGLSN